MGVIFLPSGVAHVDNVINKRCSKQSHGCPCQGCKATNHTVTLRNLPNPASGTYTTTHRNFWEPSGRCTRNWNHHTPESGTFGNLPPEPAPATRTGTHRSLSGLKTPLANAVGEKRQTFSIVIRPAACPFQLPTPSKPDRSVRWEFLIHQMWSNDPKKFHQIWWVYVNIISTHFFAPGFMLNHWKLQFVPPPCPASPQLQPSAYPGVLALFLHR